MSGRLVLVLPQVQPELDADFRPAVLVNRKFREQTAAGGVPLVIGLERCDGEISRFTTQVFPSGHPQAAANLDYVERMVKFLLWQRGAWRVYVGGPREIGEYVQKCYAPGGDRRFDFHFMGEQVYEHWIRPGGFRPEGECGCGWEGGL